MSDAHGELRTARAVLEEGLALLDGAVDDDPRRFFDLAQRLAQLPDPEQLRASVEPEELDAFDDAVEELQRLNAVLVTALRRDREDVGTRLAAVRAVRRDLRPHGAPTSAEGVRCDITG